MKTSCEACISWDRPTRFRRICPLLVETDDGLRCSANAHDVRPFWGRATALYAGTALAIYLAGAVAIFFGLRLIGYPINIFHVALPPLWHRVTEVRGWFFYDRANRSFAEGKTAEGLLYLTNSYEFDPQNYPIGLALAKSFQIGHAAQSDKVFARLIKDHPNQQHTTAQAWFRALLARGNYTKITELAQTELRSDARHSTVWARAILVAARQTNDTAVIATLAASEDPRNKVWGQLFSAEKLFREGRVEAARTALEGSWPAPTSPVFRFMLFYRIATLTQLGAGFTALDLLARHPQALDAEAEITVKLEAYAALKADRLLRKLTAELLDAPFTATSPSLINLLCAHLIRHPDVSLFSQLWGKVTAAQLPMNSETASAWFSLLCTAGAVGDRERLQEITERIKDAAKTPFVSLGLVEAFFRGQTSERQSIPFLPILPLPIEVTYALLQRYQPASSIPAPPDRPR